ncbi:MAG TPA: hypothetical protein VHK28_05865 [Candidatus Limnocylindria bacterium]|nr:hypothetical protein [Candidatus Limnocylindria bacterium]
MSRFVLIFAALMLLGAIALSAEGLIGPVAVLTGFVVVMHVRTRPRTDI